MNDSPWCSAETPPRKVQNYALRLQTCLASRPLGLILGLLLLVTTCTRAANFLEDFSTDPTVRDWRVAGDESLFRWDSARRNLAVTWDSSRPNSFFYRPLGTILTKSDDFAFGFEISLAEVAVGVQPGKPFTFELAVGFLNLRQATDPKFARGSGTQSPNLVEFDYFPDSGFGATISPVIVSTNGQFIPSFSFPFELTPGDRFQVMLSYRAINQTLVTTMTRNGAPFGPIKDVKLPASFTDFRVDTLAISSFNDAGADGSILARGAVDNLSVEIPDAPVSGFEGTIVGARWQIQFQGRTNWIYTLERSDDLNQWTAAALPTLGSGERQTLVDEGALAAKAYYRIKAERP